MTDSLHKEPSTGGKKCCDEHVAGLTECPHKHVTLKNGTCAYIPDCICNCVPCTPSTTKDSKPQSESECENCWQGHAYSDAVGIPLTKCNCPCHHPTSPRSTADSKEPEIVTGNAECDGIGCQHYLTCSGHFHSECTNHSKTPTNNNGWEEEFDREFISRKMKHVVSSPERLKSFISTLLVNEREKQRTVFFGEMVRECNKAHAIGRTQTKEEILKLIEERIVDLVCICDGHQAIQGYYHATDCQIKTEEKRIAWNVAHLGLASKIKDI